MLLRLSALLIATGLAIPASAANDRDMAEPSVAANESATPEDKIICRSKREARTGSNLRRGRECRTASEWKEREVVAQRELQRLRDKQQTPGNALGR